MPYYTTLPDTLLVGSTDIQSLAGIVVEDFSGLFAPGTRRGQNDVIPGRQGQLGAPKVYDAYAFSIPITVLPYASDGTMASTLQARRAQTIANLRAASAALAGTNGLVALTRRLSSGASSYVSHTCSGEFVEGLGLTLLNTETGQTELQFVNLDGAWWDAATSTWLVP
jgi:hypothetical protein